MNNKKNSEKIIFIFFILFLLIIGNIYVLGYTSTKKTLKVIGRNGEISGIYSNIRSLSHLLNLITPKNNEIECLFEIYFNYGSEEFSENKGEFLGNILIYFLGEGLEKIAEYYFNGVVIQANTKLNGIIWIEKEKYKKIRAIHYQISESDSYRSFNDLYYKDIYKIREREKKIVRDKGLNRKRTGEIEKASENYFKKLNRK